MTRKEKIQYLIDLKDRNPQAIALLTGNYIDLNTLIDQELRPMFEDRDGWQYREQILKYRGRYVAVELASVSDYTLEQLSEIVT